MSKHRRARATDPDTSHEAAEAVDVTYQCWLVLRVYQTGWALLDHDAYRLAGLTVAINGARQRCSDLRQEGLIARTGDRARTPSGRAGYLCRITPRGLDYLKRMSGHA